jgi:hypothetical protein
MTTGTASSIRPLPAATRLDTIAARFGRLRSRWFGDPPVPTLMHVTHAKAGSTWISNLLEELFRTRVAPRGKYVAEATGGDLSRHVFEPGRVYRATFISRDEFLAHPELRSIKRFVVIRDLRDTLVSLYFSLKVSHPLDARGRTKKHRDKLNEFDFENGLRYLLIDHVPRVAAIQRSWLGHGEIVLRYEDLLENSFELLRTVLVAQLALPITESALARAIRRTHFETVFQRKLGEEDVQSHGRKGQSGDWKNHFSPSLRRDFAETYGPLLIETGYEKDLGWSV